MENDVTLVTNSPAGKQDESVLLVTVVTPVLNCVKYVEACIRSVLNQSYPHTEHFFVDGGSTDGTSELLARYHAQYPGRINYTSGPDENPADAWNKGLRLAKGDIFGWLGADDTYEPDAVQTVVEFFKSNPDARFAYGDCNIIDDRNGKTERFRTRDSGLEELLMGPCYMATPSAFYKREVVERIGLMDTRFSGNGCDLDYWMRVAKVFKLHRIDAVLSNFRLRSDSISGSSDAFTRYGRVCYVISRRHGGPVLSNYGIVYFGSPLIKLLKPILGPLYPFVSDKIVYPLARQARKLGKA